MEDEIKSDKVTLSHTTSHANFPALLWRIFLVINRNFFDILTFHIGYLGLDKILFDLQFESVNAPNTTYKYLISTHKFFVLFFVVAHWDWFSQNLIDLYTYLRTTNCKVLLCQIAEYLEQMGLRLLFAAFARSLGLKCENLQLPELF